PGWTLVSAADCTWMSQWACLRLGTTTDASKAPLVTGTCAGCGTAVFCRRPRLVVATAVSRRLEPGAHYLFCPARALVGCLGAAGQSIALVGVDSGGVCVEPGY